FAHFTASDLQNLGTGEAICRVERAELNFNLRTRRPPEPSDESAQRVREEVIRLTHERYAVPRAEVEAMLARSRGPDESEVLLSRAGTEGPTPHQAQRRRASRSVPEVGNT